MKKKILLVLVLPTFLLATFAGGALAAKKPGTSPMKASVVYPTDDGREAVPSFGATPLIYEGDKGANCFDIHPDTAVHVLEHDQWGWTYYDYQKNGSMGRMIAVTSAGQREMVFMYLPVAPFTPAHPRFVDYNCKSPGVLGTWCGQKDVDGGIAINAGYVNIAAMHNGREAIIYHKTGSDEPWATSLALGDTGYVCSGDNSFGSHYDIPDSLGGTNSGEWPKIGIVYDASVDTEYMHIVMTEGKTSGGDQKLGYVRCHLIAGDTLLCETPTGQDPAITSPIKVPVGTRLIPNRRIGYFGETSPGSGQYPNTISAIVVASPVSKKLAIVFTNKRQSGTGQYNNDVCYVESDSNGNEWFRPGNWPPTIANGMLHYVTNYATGDAERAYTDVSACYDYKNHLHVVWNGCWYDSAGGSISNQANINHWRDTDPTGTFSVVAPGYWTGTAPGAWNRNVCKMSISAKDPIYHGGNLDSVYLFCTWTQFNGYNMVNDKDSLDVSKQDYSNGEIYAAVSNDSGRTWTPGFNLTGTYTPDCDSAWCLSEHWSSLAENMYDGDLHLEYVCDKAAGGAIQETSTPWTLNPMMYMHIKQLPCPKNCGEAIANQDPSSWTIPPIKVSPTGSRTISFHLKGIYNLGGSYEVTPHYKSGVQCISNCAGFLNPGDDRLVEITINCSGQGFIKDTIIVTTCQGTDDEKIIKMPIYAVCSDDYYECKRAANTQFRPDNDVESLWVCANTEERVWDKRLPDDSDQVIMSAGVIAAFMSDGTPIVGRQDYTDMRTGARDTMHILEVVDGDCRIQRVSFKNTYIWYPPDVIPEVPKWYWLNINKQIILFYNSPGHTCPEWKKEQVIKHVWINWGRYPAWWPNPDSYAGHPDIYYGVYADLDAPYDSSCRVAGGETQSACNTAGWEDVNKILWQHGFTSTPAQHTPLYEKYYLGMALTNTSGGIVTPVGCKDVRNTQYLYPNAGWGWQDSQLYRLATTPFSAATVVDNPDSVVDRSVVMTAGKIPAGGANDTTFQGEFILIEALLPNGSLDALKTHIINTRAVLIPHLNALGLFSKELAKCGDVDNDGNVDAADIVYLINYLFIQGPPIPPPTSRADVNGDYKIDLADVIYLCNYLYHPGSPPPNCPYLPGYIPPSWGNDPLNRDTVYVRVEDPKSTPEGTDIPVTIWGSNDEDLEAIIAPFCWTGDCYLDPAKNSTDRQSPYYVFRNYDGIPNRLKPYADSGWSPLLAVDSANNKSLFLSGGCVAHYLHPVSGLFATFVFTSNQPTAPLIDTCFYSPSHHLLFVEPNNNYFVPQFRTWDLVDCGRSYSDPCLVACPLGDIPFKVHLKDSKGHPVANYSNVWLDFYARSGIIPCPSETSWPIVYPDGPSDGSGVVTFHVHAGGCDQSCLVSVKTDRCTIASIPVRTLDNSGNLYVSYSDFDSSYGLCRDYNFDGAVDYNDLAFFNEHKRHGCTTGPPNPCQFFRKYLIVDPDTNLSPPGITEVKLFVQNNSTTDCSIDSIKFYYSGFGALDTLKLFSSLLPGYNLSPGDSLIMGADYLWHDTTAVVFYARFYTDCCSTYIQVERNINRVRQCPPTAMEVKFGWDVGFSPVYLDILSFMPTGWNYIIDYSVLPDSGVIISTSNLSPLGAKGSLSLAAFRDPGKTDFVAERTFEAFVTLNSGDANGDCIVNVSDVVYMINYLFIFGPAPNPLRAADANCDGRVNASDVVYLINYLFIGGPPPPCSE